MPRRGDESTLAFVGFTNKNEGETGNEKAALEESGLWVSRSGQTGLVNINPGYSDSNGRDFGRGVSINGRGFLVARDREFVPASASSNSLVPLLHGFTGPTGPLVYSGVGFGGVTAAISRSTPRVRWNFSRLDQSV